MLALSRTNKTNPSLPPTPPYASSHPHPPQITPLHIAVTLNSLPIAKLLLGAGASHRTINHLGSTSLQLAVGNHCTPMVQLLRNYGASLQLARPHSITTAVAPGAAGLWNAENALGLLGLGVSAEDVARVRASWSFARGEY